MKKRLFFITIFASLALIITLSLVLLVNHNNSKTLEMEESTEANDELFGDYTEFESPSYELLTEAPAAPKYGYQVAYPDSTHISIRFIAQIKGLDFSAKWNRRLINNDGTKYADGNLGEYTDKESTYAYTSLKNGDKDDLVPEEGYDHFVVYTLKNIPISTTSPFKLQARLKLRNDAGVYDVDSYETVVAADKFTYYLNPNIWFGAKAKFYARCIAKGDTRAEWILLDPTTSGYKLDVDRDLTAKIIFARVSGDDPRTTPNDDFSNVWNQTADLENEINSIGKTYTINSWAEGKLCNGSWGSTSNSSLDLITVDLTSWDDWWTNDSAEFSIHIWNNEGNTDIYMIKQSNKVWKTAAPKGYTTYKLYRWVGGTKVNESGELTV